MTTEKKKLTTQQEKAIFNLMSCKSTDAAADATGITRMTLWRWRQMPEFKARLNTEKQHAIEEASILIQGASATAAGVLVTMAKDEEAPSTSRFKAAKLILEYSTKIREVEEVIQRLDNLEEQIGEDQTKKGWGQI